MDSSENKSTPHSNEQSDNEDDAEEAEAPAKADDVAEYSCSSSSNSSSDSESDDDDVTRDVDDVSGPLKELTLQDDDEEMLLIQPPLDIPEDDEGDDYGACIFLPKRPIHLCHCFVHSHFFHTSSLENLQFSPRSRFERQKTKHSSSPLDCRHKWSCFR